MCDSPIPGIAFTTERQALRELKKSSEQLEELVGTGLLRREFWDGVPMYRVTDLEAIRKFQTKFTKLAVELLDKVEFGCHEDKPPLGEAA